MEIWKPCRNFPRYVVSPEGLIKNRDRDNVVTTRQNLQGIVMVNLSGIEGRKTRSVALIVAQAYLAPPKNHAYNSVIHLDGDKTNCSARNLMWRPRWYSVNYHDMFTRAPIDISVMIEDTGEVFGTLREACTKYGLDDQRTYLDLIRGDPCFHYGYRLKRMR